MGVFHWFWQSPLQQVSTTVLSVTRCTSIPSPFLVHAILSERTGCVQLNVGGCRVSRWHEWRTVCFGGRQRKTTTTTFWKWLFRWHRSAAGEGPSTRQIFVNALFCIQWSSRRELLPLLLLTGTFISKVKTLLTEKHSTNANLPAAPRLKCWKFM